jgi:hypothetical protein
MSLGIYPVFEPKLRGAKFGALGEILAHNFEALDHIAEVANLTPFTAFADTREVPADFSGSPDDLEDLLGLWTEWFDPAKGRAAIQALVNHIKSNPAATKTLDYPEAVVSELEEMVRVLAVAETEAVRFRLQMS